MSAPKFIYRGPVESDVYFRVTVLLYRLWDCDLLPGSEKALQRLIDNLASGDSYVGETLELTPKARRLVANWAFRYLKSNNPDLCPFIFSELTNWARMKGDSVYRASAGLERSARSANNPLLLPRPSNRMGRERYSAALERHRDRQEEGKDTAIDGLRAWEHAEAWIKVRHGLTKLADHVKDVGTRDYTIPGFAPDDELQRITDRQRGYNRWWRNLKAVDEAIKAIVWPISPSSN